MLSPLEPNVFLFEPSNPLSVIYPPQLVEESLNWTKAKLIPHPSILAPSDEGVQPNIGLEVIEVVADQIGDDVVLCHYLLLKDTDFILKGFYLSKLESLDDHQ